MRPSLLQLQHSLVAMIQTTVKHRCSKQKLKRANAALEPLPAQLFSKSLLLPPLPNNSQPRKRSSLSKLNLLVLRRIWAHSSIWEALGSSQSLLKPQTMIGVTTGVVGLHRRSPCSNSLSFSSSSPFHNNLLPSNLHLNSPSNLNNSNNRCTSPSLRLSPLEEASFRVSTSAALLSNSRLHLAAFNQILVGSNRRNPRHQPSPQLEI